MSTNKHLDTTFARFLTLGLQGKPLYYGTVPAAEVQRRRVKGRLARAARRITRKGKK